ncbi:hypothetical protein ACIGEL_15705 [Rossellomorea aquimaris]|uniref:hypothetical protein n=1 Tax=Rossellomorea aquimaris TaxID=189382 RepID=UPI0037C56EB3
MKYVIKQLPFVIMFILLVSCGDDTDQYHLIASEKTLPSNFYETAIQREKVPFFHYGLAKADNQKDYEEYWGLYQLEKKIPSIDFNKKSVFFIGLTESGSCPMELTDLEVNQDKKTMTLFLNDSGGDCTSDATPRTFVIGIDEESSRDFKNVVIVDGEVETSIPIEY